MQLFLLYFLAIENVFFLFYKRAEKTKSDGAASFTWVNKACYKFMSYDSTYKNNKKILYSGVPPASKLIAQSVKLETRYRK